MKHQVLFIFLFITSQLFAQLPGDNALIVTNEQNIQWLDSIEKQDLESKVSMIKHRILSDTVLFIRRTYPDRIKLKDQYNDKKRVEGSCRILLVFDGKLVDITNATSNKTVEELADLLKFKDFKSIMIVRDAAAAAIYGARGSCGVLVLESKSRKVRRKMSKLNLG